MGKEKVCRYKNGTHGKKKILRRDFTIGTTIAYYYYLNDTDNDIIFDKSIIYDSFDRYGELFINVRGWKEKKIKTISTRNMGELYFARIVLTEKKWK